MVSGRGRMDDYRKEALRDCHYNLTTAIIVANILPRLHVREGGFLNDVESDSIGKNGGNARQVEDLVDILLKKENKDFDYFCDVLEKEGYQAFSSRLREAAGLGSVAEAPPNTLNTLELQDYYINIKKMFVRVCTKLGSPTLGEVKDLCLDMLAGVFIRIPRVSHLENAIERATTMDEVMNIVCFHLSNWVSYDFLRIVITHFQPALKSVADDLMHYERKLKPLLLQKLEHIAELQQQKEAPPSMGELIVKYQLDADELKVKDLIAARDFLAQRLGVPEYLLQVLSWGKGSVVITYWIERDMLPLAELALHHDDVIAELTEHCVEAIYFGNPSFHPGHMDQPLQSMQLQRRAIVAVLNAHHKNLDVNMLASDLQRIGILTTKQCQMLTCLDDKERKHEALLYIFLAHKKPRLLYQGLVECMGQRDISIATDFQATFTDLRKSPDAVPVIVSSQYDADDMTGDVDGTQFSSNSERTVTEMVVRFDEVKEMIENVLQVVKEVGRKEIQGICQVKDALHHLTLVVKMAYGYLDKMYDIFYYCQSHFMKQAIQKLNGSPPDLNRLCNLVNLLGNSLQEAKCKNLELVKACNVAICEAAEVCGCKETDSQNKKAVARIVGGTLAGTALTGKTAVAAGGIVAGSFTFSVRICIATVATGITGVVGPSAAVIRNIAKKYKYNRSEDTFRRMCAKFDPPLRLVFELKGVAHSTQMLISAKVSNFQDSTDKEGISFDEETLKHLEKACSDTYVSTSTCRDEVKKKLK